MKEQIGTIKTVKEVVEEAKKQNTSFVLDWVWDYHCEDCGKPMPQADDELGFEGDYKWFLEYSEDYPHWKDNDTLEVELVEYSEKYNQPIYRNLEYVNDDFGHICKECYNKDVCPKCGSDATYHFGSETRFKCSDCEHVFDI